MKSFKLFLNVLFTLFILNSCNDEINEQPSTPSNTSNELVVEVKNGIMVFDDYPSMQRATYNLGILNKEQIQNFNQKNNFNSQQNILNNVIQEEENYYNSLVKGYGSEAKSLDKSIIFKRTEAYEKALKKGLITVEEDSENAHVYHLSCIDPTLSNVLNEDGFVQVGQELWQYKKDIIKLCKNCGPEDKSKLEELRKTNDERGLYIFDKNNTNSRLNFDWSSDQTKPFKVTGNSSRRARWRYTGYSLVTSNCQSCLMTTKFFVHFEAMWKNYFGSWVYNSVFTPTFRWDGTWSGNAVYTYCTTDPLAPATYIPFTFPISSFTVPTGVTNTPMVNRTFAGGNNNNTSIMFHPHSNGYWPNPPSSYGPYNATKCWEDAVKIFNIAIDGKLINDCTSCDLPDN